MISSPAYRALKGSIQSGPKASTAGAQCRKLNIIATSRRNMFETNQKRELCIAPSSQITKSLIRQNLSTSSVRSFSSTRKEAAKNRIYTSVRRPDELQTYILSSTSSRIPLITLWTASYCSSCHIITPLVKGLIESGVGESSSTSVSFCEVEFDSKDIMDSGMGMDYLITSLPTLVTFDRGEVILDTKVTDVAKLKDEKWLREWIEREAQRKGEGTGGLGGGGGFFGGLFGSLKK